MRPSSRSTAIGVGNPRGPGHPLHRVHELLASSRRRRKAPTVARHQPRAWPYSVVQERPVTRSSSSRIRTDLGEQASSCRAARSSTTAVLRAFELLTGRERRASRHRRPHGRVRRGASGPRPHQPSGFPGERTCCPLTRSRPSRAPRRQDRKTLQGCAQNHCQLTVNDVRRRRGHGRASPLRHGQPLRARRVPGARGQATKADKVPNLLRLQVQAPLRPLHAASPRRRRSRGDRGHPARARACTRTTRSGSRCFTEAGLPRHDLGPLQPRTLFETGMESIPSENVCYPAKLVARAHHESLLDKGITTASGLPLQSTSSARSSPRVPATHFNCPIVATYPEVTPQQHGRACVELGHAVHQPLAVNYQKEHLQKYLPAHLIQAPSSSTATTCPRRRRSKATPLDKAWEEDAAVQGRNPREGRRNACEWMREDTACAASCWRAAPTTSTPRSTTASPRSS